MADGVFPAEVLASSVNYLPQCQGVRPPQGVWAHICGSDLVRDADGTMYVLEDNLRVPSGVSYMLENRQLTKRVFADLFRDLDIHPVDDYPNKLAGLLAALSPRPGEAPVIAVLTPGIFNSAYFEHAFLAQQMGAHLVEGKDLVVESGRLRLHADHRWPRPRRRHLPPGRRRFPRSRGVPARFHRRCPRAHAGLARRQRRHCQRARSGGGRRQGRLLLRARADPLLPRRGPDDPQRPDLAVPSRQTIAATCYPTSTRWS